MKLLVSDYDGTFNFFYQAKLINRNIDAINAFRRSGNLFAISTARSFNSILNEMRIFNIPYDYLICKNGRDIINEDGEIIYSQTFNDEDMDSFLDMVDYRYGIKKASFFDAKGEEVMYDAVVSQINTSKLVSGRRVRELGGLLSSYSKIQVLLNRITVSTVSNKRDAIIELLRYLKYELKKCDVYTIGNAANDYLMLRDYQGHKMFFSSPTLLLSDIPFAQSVYSLVKKIG